jgi:DNA-binding CsgD family transcriptional regulator
LLKGDYEQAAALNEEAAALLRERGYKGGLEMILDNQGWAALLQGDHDAARTYYAESLTLCKELDDRMIAAESLEGLACISVVEGDAKRAAKMFGAAEILREVVGFKHTPEEDALREPYLAAACSLVDEEAWEEAWVEGKTMGLQQAVEYALAEETHAAQASSTPEQSSAGAQPSNLTRREREVAALVVQGLTNHRIAQTLVISERTVENHVAHILNKLKLHSREQITFPLAQH